MVRAAACSVALVGALGAAGCGGGSSDTDEVTGLARQVANSDEKVCDHAVGDFLKQVGGTKARCRQAARQGNKKAKPQVGHVKVDGDKATAVISDGKSKATLQLTKQDGDWQISSVR